MSSRLPRPEHPAGRGTIGAHRVCLRDGKPCDGDCIAHDHSECCHQRAFARVVAARGLRHQRRVLRWFCEAVLA